MEGKKVGVIGRKVIKICESYLVTLPPDFVRAHGLKAGDSVLVYYNDVVRIEPVKKEEILRKCHGEK